MGPAELDRRVLLSYEEEPATFVRGGCCSRRMCACLGRRSQGLQVAAVLVTVQLIFGGYAIVVKVAMRDHVDALVFSLYRDIGATAVLLGACTLMGERKPVLPGDRLLFLGVGLHCALHARGTHTRTHTRGGGPHLYTRVRIHGASTAPPSLSHWFRRRAVRHHDHTDGARARAAVRAGLQRQPDATLAGTLTL